MSLGSRFPREFLREQLRRQLKPGIVVKLRVEMDDKREHEKRFVVVGVGEHMASFVINSEPGAFLTRRPALLKCQVKIDAVSHPFMNHDSHIDCSRVREYSLAEVLKQLQDEPSWVLGSVTESVRAEIAAAIKASPTISVADATALCASLDGAR